MTAATVPPSEATESVPRVALTGISKRFGATQALSDVSISLMPGTIHALVGENGAGKSTLVKILAGMHQPDTGTISLDGDRGTIHDPAASRAMGIAVVHQEPSLFPDLSVAENVFLGDPPRRRFGGVDWPTMRREARKLFEELDVNIDVTTQVRGLSLADQQLIEIAKALAIKARVLVMDEPTASLSPHEVTRLFSIARQTRDSGVAVMFVSHRLDEVFDLCDETTVLRDGQHVVTTPTADLTTDDLVRYMVGREVSLFPRVESHAGDVLLGVDRLTRTGVFQDVTFDVHAGEIVGFAGLVGAGRTEIARVLFGIDHPDSGTISLRGDSVRFSNPSAALAAGMAYVSEDRHGQGLVLDFSITSNITLPILARLFPKLFIRRAFERRFADSAAQQLDVRMTSVDQPVDALSGGNQQKVVLAKWLATNPVVLILDEPTRGIDIGSKAEVHRIISELAATGLGIILISSELPEILAMSDRILVLHEGEITGRFDRAEADEEGVMFAATGQAASEGAAPQPIDPADVPSSGSESDD
jgi:rhamnose transport system ATP-binding protein